MAHDTVFKLPQLYLRCYKCLSVLVHVQSHTVKYTAVREHWRNVKCKESKALTEQPLGDNGEVVALGT